MFRYSCSKKSFLYVRRMKELKCPELLAEHYKPLSCRIHQWVSTHALIIVPVCSLVLHSERQTLSALDLVSKCWSLLTKLRYTACGMFIVALESPQETVFCYQSWRALPPGVQSIFSPFVTFNGFLVFNISICCYLLQVKIL